MDDLDELRKAVQDHRAEGKKILSHYNRLEREYSDWEDRLVEIENAISEAEKITGLTKEEVIEPHDILDDILG